MHTTAYIDRGLRRSELEIEKAFTLGFGSFSFLGCPYFLTRSASGYISGCRRSQITALYSKVSILHRTRETLRGGPGGVGCSVGDNIVVW